MKLFASLTVVLIVGATLVANSGAGKRLFVFLRYIPGGDMTGHFLLYAMLGLTVAVCLRRSIHLLVNANWFWGIFVIGLVVVAEEFSQAWIPTRTLSYADMIASLAGLFTGSIVSLFWRRRQVSGPTQKKPEVHSD